MTESTEQHIVPVWAPPSTTDVDALDEPSHPPEKRGPRWGWVTVGVLGALIAGVIAATQISIAYFEFRPGSARPIRDLVTIDEDVAVYPPSSDIAFTTVSLRRSTIASYILATFDDDIQLVEERLVLGNRSASENRQFNLQLMDTSKQDAVRVALLALGFSVPITVDGLVVIDVSAGSPADGVVEPGDTIVSIEGQVIDDNEDVSRIMDGRQPGDEVTFEIEPPTRDGTETITVLLASAPDDSGRGVIGVSLNPRNPVYEFPFEIDIDTGAVGGPSAGLAFTLTVLDVLTPGELTGGLQVAVTGTIDGVGNVGQVGGVRQKTAAAITEGYDVFLVPPEEFDEATARAGDALQVVAVATLREALDALKALGGSGLDAGGAG